MTPREEYEQDPQAWTEEHTVGGIRPSAPQSAEDRARAYREIIADWSGIADTGEINIIRGSE